MNTFLKKINKESKKTNFTIQKKSGFTIIETLVAIFILLITTTGPLTFAQSGLRASFLARDQVTAFYLAQEPIEMLKNIRDTNQIEANPNWLYNIGQCTPGGEGITVSCDISAIGFSTISCGEEKCTQPLGYNDDTKIFSIGGGSETSSKYTRTVYVTLLNPNELQVIVDVSWESQFLTSKRVVIQENIYRKY